MKNSFFLLLTLLTACSTLKVTSDYDTTADFSVYKTFKLTDEALSLSVSDLDRNRLLAAVRSELVKKGFTESANADVLVDLKIMIEHKQDVNVDQNYYGGAYRYRWGGGFSTSTVTVNNYRQGTLFIDLIDAKKNQLVWHGSGTEVLDDDSEMSPAQREQNINEAVAKILAQYPPVKKS